MSKSAAPRSGSWSPALVPLALALATLVLTTSALPSAQAPLWEVKDVAALELGPWNCLRYPRVNGFDFAPDGTPIVGWTQVEGCGGNTWTAWAEERDGAWQAHVFPPPVQGTYGAHEMGLGGDGQPYMFVERHVNSYYDVVVADLRAFAAGAPGVVATGEGLGPSCLSTRFRLATVAGQAWPSRALQLAFCSGSGPLRLDGTTLIENFTNRGHDYSVGPSGQPHIAYVDGGGGVYYLRPGRTPVRVATVNRFSDDIGVAEGADGVIHMVVRGFDTTADYDRAYLGYLRSTDDGLTWTYVDRVDANKDQWGLSLQVDAAGKPAVAYWYYNQLTYATRASGAWVKSLVAEPVWENTEWLKQPRLRFDAAGIPHIAYYDWTANRVRVAAPEFYQPPTIVNPGNQNSVEGDTVSLPIAGTVSDGKIRAFMATGLPPGLSIHPTTGVISGTLLPGSAGSHSATVTISDGVTDVRVQFVWTVTAPPPPPTFPTLVLPGGYSYAASYGAELTYDIVASTTNAGATLLPITHSALPAGATLAAISETGPPASRTYRFAWTPQPAYNANGTLITSRTVCYGISDSAGQAMLGNSCVTVTLPPAPTRFAHGTLSWVRDLSHVSATTHKVRITFEGAFQRSFAWPSGTPQVGTVLAGLVDLDLSGAGYLDTVTPPFTVTAVNAADDFITGTAVVDVEVPMAALPVTATFAGCCRLSSVRDGNASTAFTLRTTIDSATITRSPSSNVAPRIYATVNQPLSLQLPAAPSDGLNNRFAFAPPAESGLVTQHPGGAMLSSTGLVSWTPETEGLYAVQFIVTSVDTDLAPKASAPVELIFDVRAPCTTCATVTVEAPLTADGSVGLESRAVVTATTSLPGHVPELLNTPLAPGMQLRPLTTGQSSTWEVTWTPTPGQSPVFVCFQARDGSTTSPGQACTTFDIAASSLRTLTGVLREFQATHPDMNRPNGDAAPLPDFVGQMLQADLKPAFDAAAGASVSQFEQWFNDVPGVNTSRVHSLWLGNANQLDPGLFQFSSTNWLPTGSSRFFTYEAHTAITHVPGRQVTFKASGDMWIFINRMLVPASNLHGVHGERSLTVNMDALSGLVEGESYPVDIFYAHRGAATTPGIQLQLGAEPPIPAIPEVVTIPTGGFTPAVVNPLGVAQVNAGQLQVLGGTGTNDAGAGWLAADFFWPNGFELEFTYTGSPVTSGEGFAAVIAAAPALGGGADGLGYDGIPGSLAVEFDARQSSPDDLPYQHIAVHSNEGGANSSLTSAAIGVQPSDPGLLNSFYNASPQRVRVAYTPVATQPFGWVRVWMNDNLLPAIETMLSRNALAALLNNGRGFFGFTAGRGATTSSLTIQSARLTTYPEPLLNHPPEVPVFAGTTSFEGAFIQRLVLVTDPEGDPISFEVTGLPPGIAAVAYPVGSPDHATPHVLIGGTSPLGSAGVYPGRLTVRDGIHTSAQDFTWTVRPPNRRPVAIADTAMTGDDLTIPVLVNDSDPDGDPLTIVEITQPEHGSAGVFGDEIRYQRPFSVPSGFIDTFTYTIDDGNNGRATATVKVHVLSGESDLSIAIAPPTKVVALNQDFAVSAVVTNQSVESFGSATIQIRAPEGLDLLSVAGATPAGPERFTVGALAPGQSQTLSVLLRASNNEGPYSLEASIVASVPEENTSNNRATALVLVQPNFCFASPYGLRGQWHADGSYLSSPPLGNPQGDAAFGPSRRGEAFAFDAAQGHMVRLRTGGDRTSTFTIAAWAKPALVPGFAPVFGDGLFRDGAASGRPPDTKYWLGFEDGHPVLALYDDRTRVANLKAAMPVLAGAWVHLAASYDGRTARLYVDGVEVVQHLVSVPLVLVEDFYLGRAFAGEFQDAESGPPSSFTGLIDDVAVWGRVLSAAEVHRLVAGDATGCAVVTSPSLALAVAASPAFAQVNGVIEFTATVTNTGDGYLTDVAIEQALDPMVTFIEAQPAAAAVDPMAAPVPLRWAVGPLLAGESRSITVSARGPNVDGRFVHRASAVDVGSGVSVGAEAPFTVAPEMCLVTPDGLVASWREMPPGFAAPEAGRVGPGLSGAVDVMAHLGERFTVTGWIRPGTLTVNGWAGLLQTRPAGQWPILEEERLALGLLNGVPTVRIVDVAGAAHVVAANAPLAEPSRWHHLAMTFEGSMIRLYVDGVLVTDAGVGGIRAAAAGEEIMLGFDLTGIFDEVLVYDRALSDAEVSRFVNGSQEGCPINEPPSIVAPAPQVNRIGDEVNLVVTASDPDNLPSPLTFTANGLPAGLSIDSATGIVSGVVGAEASGTHAVLVTVTDGARSASAAFAWDVPHRVQLTMGRGGRAQAEGQICDATGGPASCVFHVAHRSLISFEPDFAAGAMWARWQDGTNVGESVFAVTASSSLEVEWLARFFVTLEGASGATSSLLGASVSLRDPATMDTALRDYLLCPATDPVACQGRAVLGSTVNLYGSSNDRRLFEGFGGACAGSECAVVLDRPNQEVLARFTPRPVGLTLRVGAGGSVRVLDLSNDTEVVCDGPATGESTCEPTFPYGAWLRLEPFHASGGPQHWVWDSAEGIALPAPDAAVQTTLTAPVTLGVSFRSVVVVTIEGWRMPSVAAVPPITFNPASAWRCSAASSTSTTCTRLEARGQVVTLTPNPGAMTFKGWGGACESAGLGPCTLTTDQPEPSATARFAVPLTVTVNGGGAVLVGGAGRCDGGASGRTCVYDFPFDEPVTLSAELAMPGAIWRWDGATARTESVWVSDSLTASTNMSAPRAVSLTFLVRFDISAQVGVVSATLPDSRYAYLSEPPSLPAARNQVGEAPIGSTVRLVAEPPAGYAFSGWTGACSGLGPCALTLGQPGLAVGATYSQVPVAGANTSVTTNATVAVTIVVTGTDPEGNALSAEQVGDTGVPATSGVLTKSGALSWLFTPNTSFVGDVTFSYRLTDGFGFSEVRQAVITVQAPTIVTVNIVENISVTDAVVAQPAVMIAITEAIQVTDGVTSTVSNTPAGSGVTVAASGPGPGPSPVSLTFAGVTQPGNTTYSVVSNLAAPDGFAFGTPPVLIDIVTTAQYTAPVRVCLTYPAGSATNPSALRLFHRENGRWIDRTVSVDVKTRVVCGSVSSLSPFALAEAIAIEGRLHGEGEIDATGIEYRIDFKVAERQIGRERGELDLAIRSPRRGRQRESVNRFESTGIDEIYFWDDPVFRPSRNRKPRPAADSVVFTGTGKWNGQRGYTFEARATDQGEPGRGRDRFAITVRDASGAVVATIDGVLTDGNIQSERLNREHWR